MAFHKNERAAVLLEKGSEVNYRSSESLKKIEGVMLRYHTLEGSLVVEVRGNMFHLNPAEIKRLKARDYIEGNDFVWALVMVYKGVQHAFTFETQEERDFWDEEITCFMRSCALNLTGDNANLMPTSYRAVTKVDIRDPEHETQPDAGRIAVSLKLEMALPRSMQSSVKSDFEVFEGTSAVSMKKQVVDFVNAYNLLPTEGTSLYRLVKSLYCRQQILRETEQFIREIQAQHLGELWQGKNLSGDAGAEEVAAKASEALSELAASIPRRLGTSGCGAQFVGVVLTRNIEKLRVINEMISHLRLQTLNRQVPQEGSTPRITPRPGTVPRDAEVAQV